MPPILDTVYVELLNPPKEIKLPMLPVNVVPIIPETRRIKCSFPNDSEITVTRTQIPIIANFAMTDFCSQGRTRMLNIVHISHCRSHQSYYTCLSRSSLSEGTYIIGKFISFRNY